MDDRNVIEDAAARSSGHIAERIWPHGMGACFSGG